MDGHASLATVGWSCPIGEGCLAWALRERQLGIVDVARRVELVQWRRVADVSGARGGRSGLVSVGLAS